MEGKILIGNFPRKNGEEELSIEQLETMQAFKEVHDGLAMFLFKNVKNGVNKTIALTNLERAYKYAIEAISKDGLIK